MKFLKLGVIRQSSTDLYVEVPDDFDPVEILRSKHQEAVGKIAFETTDSTDWDDFEWEKDVEVCSVEPVSESEARQFTVGRLVVDEPVEGDSN